MSTETRASFLATLPHYDLSKPLPCPFWTADRIRWVLSQFPNFSAAKSDDWGRRAVYARRRRFLQEDLTPHWGFNFTPDHLGEPDEEFAAVQAAADLSKPLPHDFWSIDRAIKALKPFTRRHEAEADNWGRRALHWADRRGIAQQCAPHWLWQSKLAENAEIMTDDELRTFLVSHLHEKKLPNGFWQNRRRLTQILSWFPSHKAARAHPYGRRALSAAKTAGIFKKITPHWPRAKGRSGGAAA